MHSFPDEDLVFKYAPWALNKNEALAAAVSYIMYTRNLYTWIIFYLLIKIDAYDMCVFICKI